MRGAGLGPAFRPVRAGLRRRPRPGRRGAHGPLRVLSTLLIAAGLLFIVDAGLTVAWQEPVSALYARLQQKGLADDLSTFERAAPTPGELAALKRLKSDRRRIAFLARALRGRVDEGEPIGRIRIPRIGASFVVVEGTEPGDLRKGPGRYADTSLPGLPGTFALAGHRTTYLSPFRDIDKLGRGSDVVVEMPYGRFTYEVFRKRIVDPSDVGVLAAVPRERRLVLTACHPLYSARQRIVVLARLVLTEPRGRASA